MSRRYRRRTDRVPQDQRRLSVVSEDNLPLDLGDMADLFVMHALGQRFRNHPEADLLRGISRQLPHNRASLPAA